MGKIMTTVWAKDRVERGVREGQAIEVSHPKERVHSALLTSQIPGSHNLRGINVSADQRRWCDYPSQPDCDRTRTAAHVQHSHPRQQVWKEEGRLFTCRALGHLSEESRVTVLGTHLRRRHDLTGWTGLICHRSAN